MAAMLDAGDSKHTKILTLKLYFMSNEETNQEKNESANETRLFFEKLKELQKSTPANVSIFMCAMEKSEDRSEGMLMCDATGGELVKMFSQACTEVPKLGKAFEAALAFSKLESDPLGFLKSAFEKKDGKFPFPFPFSK